LRLAKTDSDVSTSYRGTLQRQQGNNNIKLTLFTSPIQLVGFGQDKRKLHKCAERYSGDGKESRKTCTDATILFATNRVCLLIFVLP